MILSGAEIEKKIQSGEISISPFNKVHLKPGSYVLTLGSKLRKVKVTTELDARLKPDVEEVQLTSEGFLLQPQEHILGITEEIVTLSKKYVCLISNRAGLAMLGLDVCQSSFYCEPDTTGAYTMEITNNGSIPIRIYPGLEIGKAVFAEVI